MASFTISYKTNTGRKMSKDFEGTLPEMVSKAQGLFIQGARDVQIWRDGGIQPVMRIGRYAERAIARATASRTQRAT